MKKSEVREIPFGSLRDPNDFKNCYSFWTGISFSVIVSANPSLILILYFLAEEAVVFSIVLCSSV